MSAMSLGDLIAAAGPPLASLTLDGSARSVEILSVTHDSRRVTLGTLFCCVPGATHDGHQFARAAVDDGAVALLCQRPLGTGVPELVVPGHRMTPISSNTVRSARIA